MSYGIPRSLTFTPTTCSSLYIDSSKKKIPSQKYTDKIVDIARSRATLFKLRGSRKDAPVELADSGKGNMIFEHTSISAYVFVDNGTSVYKHIFHNLCGQRLAGGLRKERQWAANEGCLFSSSSLRQQKQEAFCTFATDPTSRYALSYPSRNNIMWFSRPLLPLYFPSSSA